jgi:hypothetical protein
LGGGGIGDFRDARRGPREGKRLCPVEREH